MNAISPPFPTNPSVGEFFGNWVWNGARWICTPSAGVRVVTQVFTASGPYMPSSGLVGCVVECIGGGGGGGGLAPVTDPTLIYAAGGGGAGGYSRIALAAAIVAGGVNVNIGAGGDTAGQLPNPSLPCDGQGTTFGALCVAYGGSGAAGTNAGAGAGPGTGDVAMEGNSGGMGEWIQVPSGIAWTAATGGLGGAIFGGAIHRPVSIGSFQNGWPGADNSGAGGEGACANQIASGVPVYGGNGGSGICIVTEYCWADTSMDDCLNPPVNVNARVAVTQVPWTGPGPCPPGWGQGPYVEYEGE